MEIYLILLMVIYSYRSRSQTKIVSDFAETAETQVYHLYSLLYNSPLITTVVIMILQSDDAS
jgi:hypothetical protein